MVKKKESIADMGKIYLKKKQKLYMEQLDQLGMLSIHLMEKDKKELVGMILGMLIQEAKGR